MPPPMRRRSRQSSTRSPRSTRCGRSSCRTCSTATASRASTQSARCTSRSPAVSRWDYSDPKQLIVSDGERLWLYDPELQQATVRKVKDTLSQTPAMLLAGQSKVTDGFTVSAAGRDGEIEWVRLVPKQNDTDFKELKLGFVGGNLRRMEFADKLGQLTRVELTKIERNARLPDSLFQFVAPPGVDVIGPKA